MRRVINLVVLTLVLVACGGSTDPTSNGDQQSRAGGDDSTSSQAGNGAGDQQSGGGGDDSTSSQTDSSAGNQDGFITVEGTTYAFTYDNFGRCGSEVGDGSIVSFGNVIGDSARQVTFTYGLAEDMASGEPLMQVILMTEGGASQQYYSAVGYSGLDAVGAVESITVDGDTVRISGELQRVSDQTLVPFEGEATCDQ